MAFLIPHVGLALLAAFFFLVRRMLSAHVAPQEPPLLKPKIPFIGHIIGLMKHEASYFSILKSQTEMSAVTLPMLNQKNYFIFSPYLAQQAMRSRNLDFDLVGLAFARSVASISDQAMAERVKKGPNTYTTDTVAAIKSSLTGTGLHGMNTAMLTHVASQLNAVGSNDDGIRVQNMWLWMRDLMTMATVEAFYGHANPFRTDPAGLKALWNFDSALPAMLFMPPALARAGARHRDRIVQTLLPYFEAELDKNTDVSSFVASRTAVSRKYNVLGEDLCRGEVINIWVSTANSIPALFWTFLYIWQRPSLMDKLRDEILPTITYSGDGATRKATLDIRTLEKECPTLLGCQREGIRVSNHMVARRAITADTLLTDENGDTFLFKQGTDVMWSAKITHEMPDIWGADALQFNAERFLKDPEPDVEKKRRAAYIPFGGGAHLCPGRNFASAEALGLISTLLMGYEIVGLRPDQIQMGPRELASAIPKPMEEGSNNPVMIQRRKGWERIEWSFRC